MGILLRLVVSCLLFGFTYRVLHPQFTVFVAAWVSGLGFVGLYLNPKP